jgi:hypothetical protein
MNLNQLEIQNIRHLAFACTAACDKITYYKTLTSDQSVVTNFESVCDGFNNLKTQLSNMLGGM